MFVRKTLLTLLASLLIWGLATSFFRLFGPALLKAPGESGSFVVLLLLELATAIVLYLAASIYRRLDSAPFAATRLGVIGTIVGLTLDGFVVWWHRFTLPGLSDGQLASFTIWMVIAYALYLFIPLVMEHPLLELTRRNR